MTLWVCVPFGPNQDPPKRPCSAVFSTARRCPLARKMLYASGPRRRTVMTPPTLRLTRRALAAMVWCLAALSTTGAQEPATAPSSVPPPVRIDAVTARNGMVVAQEKRASRIGVEILEKGGNAIDAAVAVGFALAVTLPKAGNLGGGGFMLMHLAQPNEDVAIDYREAAPPDTPPDAFLDPNGPADPTKSRESGLGVGVPGTVAGLAVALDRFGSGKFTLAELIAPALALA